MNADPKTFQAHGMPLYTAVAYSYLHTPATSYCSSVSGVGWYIYCTTVSDPAHTKCVLTSMFLLI